MIFTKIDFLCRKSIYFFNNIKTGEDKSFPVGTKIKGVIFNYTSLFHPSSSKTQPWVLANKTLSQIKLNKLYWNLHLCYVIDLFRSDITVSNIIKHIKYQVMIPFQVNNTLYFNCFRISESKETSKKLYWINFYSPWNQKNIGFLIISGGTEAT